MKNGKRIREALERKELLNRVNFSTGENRFMTEHSTPLISTCPLPPITTIHHFTKPDLANRQAHIFF
jgi:hypothetical protein